MKIKLDKLPFSKKTYEVKQSVRNMRKTYKLQLAFAQNGDMEDKDDEAVVYGMLNTFDTAIKYIASVLKLDDKQTEELEDMTQDDLLNTAKTLSYKLMDIPEEDDSAESKKK